ncbi:hypothetical protein T265_01355 [Opisthorchis viverrini]|uniref:Uncharacterized protein n=1 Tax=Opisthorchis viverrini TaxID=6198 RepID=A0A075A375_OPIVI|nr:hypothetical protein T265_01355 [Opisthorchis viverrini]KER32672.1 hypothetical protein T265_01355 [Opisthorchis viverrini]
MARSNGQFSEEYKSLMVYGGHVQTDQLKQIGQQTAGVHTLDILPIDICCTCETRIWDPNLENEFLAPTHPRRYRLRTSKLTLVRLPSILYLQRLLIQKPTAVSTKRNTLLTKNSPPTCLIAALAGECTSQVDCLSLHLGDIYISKAKGCYNCGRILERCTDNQLFLRNTEFRCNE